MNTIKRLRWWAVYFSSKAKAEKAEADVKELKETILCWKQDYAKAKARIKELEWGINAALRTIPLNRLTIAMVYLRNALAGEKKP